jgi:DNA replication and repair protein RecF
VTGATTLRRLRLADFRNYAELDLAFDGRAVVLVGANGAGKTNLIEAVSLLAPGRGLRRAAAAELVRAEGAGGWAVNAKVATPAGEIEIGTGLDPAGGVEAARTVRVDRTPQRSSAALGAHVAALWLTPDMDGLFRGPASDRRRFLDRLALALDAGHGGRVAALERLLRARNRLLEEGGAERAWLDAVERELAETAVAVAATRADAVARLAVTIAAHRDPGSPFPWAEVRLIGGMDEALAGGAAAAEDRYRALLAELRPRDAAAGRATAGPHLADLEVIHGPKAAPAERSSTGEQKALLIGLVLAHARLVAQATGRAPLLLLDEIAAHLDEARRAGLFEEIDALGAHAFMTGTDRAMFRALAGRAQLFHVAEGAATEE